MLSQGLIPFLIAEVGFHPRDERHGHGHVLIDNVRYFLMENGFAVSGIYDQEVEWSGEKRLRYANVCFCNEEAFSR
jgi:hypothetical protein